MSVKSKGVMGPYGVVTLEDLPKAGDRWTIKRKATVVTAIRGGLITTAEASKRYGLSVDEFTKWQQLLKTHGVQGLRATRSQQYRA